MSKELAVETERPQNTTGKYVPGSAELATYFWETWGQSAYDSIAMNEPCEPPTDIVVHAHGEQFPMHRLLLDDIFQNTSTWPTLDGYNLESHIPANHFRALHQFAYTGYTRLYMRHIFHELSDHVRIVRSPSGIYDPILDMDFETSDVRLLNVASHILEFYMMLEGAGCKKIPNFMAHEAISIVWKCWEVLCPKIKKVTLEKLCVRRLEILRERQKCIDQITLSHEISRLEMSFDRQARF